MSDEQLSLFCFLLCIVLLLAIATPNNSYRFVAQGQTLDSSFKPHNFEPLEECTCLDHDILVQKGRKNPCPCQDGEGKGCICEECSCTSCEH